MLHPAQAHARGLEDVGLRHAELAQVRGGAEVELVGLVEQSGERVGGEERAGADDLDAVGALGLHPLRELARLLG